MTNGFTCKASAVAVALTLAALSGAASAASPGYVTDSQNQVWTTPYGLCWRTTGWSPENATAPCANSLPTIPSVGNPKPSR